MNKNTFSLKIDFRLLSLVLLAVIAGMLAFWRPWEGTSEKRKITVNGETTIQAAPDEFVFYPHFQRTGDDQEALKQQINDLGTKTLNDLKNLGVPEENIKLDGSSYGNGRALPLIEPDLNENTATLSVTVRTTDKDLAQKIQDYLQSTDAQGQLTPVTNFSVKKSKELEQQARKQAVEDARNNAEQSANELGARLGKVLEVKETPDNISIPWLRSNTAEDTAQSSLPITPGKSSFIFQVEVIFEIR